MKSTFYLFLIVICSIILTSCDPALRLELINSTDRIITISAKDLCGPQIISSTHSCSGPDTAINILSGIGNSYTHFYGIGGWNEDDQQTMSNHLDSILEVRLGRKAKSKSTLTEFGNSLMTYAFE